MGNLHRNSLAGHKVLCLIDGCHSASANQALDLPSAVQGFVRLHFGDHAGRESSMDSLQNGDSLAMLWLVSWLTRHSLHRIIVTPASAFGKVKAAAPERSAM